MSERTSPRYAQDLAWGVPLAVAGAVLMIVAAVQVVVDTVAAGVGQLVIGAPAVVAIAGAAVVGGLGVAMVTNGLYRLAQDVERQGELLEPVRSPVTREGVAD